MSTGFFSAVMSPEELAAFLEAVAGIHADVESIRVCVYLVLGSLLAFILFNGRGAK